MIDISELKFDEKGLIPAIVVDSATRDVLMLAYMNEESLRISIEKKLTCFWSRSREELWLKALGPDNHLLPEFRCRMAFENFPRRK